MTISPSKIEGISLAVIKTLISRFDNFPADASKNRNAPFHEAFLKAFSDKLEGYVTDVPFFISLSSWLHGLNTTLGQAFFENVAHILCDGKKREYTSKKRGNLKITQTQRDTIKRIMNDLSTSNKVPNLQEENEALLRRDDSPMLIADDLSADVFFEEDNKVVAIELKAVKPNSGEIKGEKQKILEGKAAFFHEFPDKEIYFFFGFPFDPTVDPTVESVTSYNKSRFFDSIINSHKYCAVDEWLVASELWDYLSGTNNTMEIILEIINAIATPDFFSKYRMLQDNSKRTSAEYLSQLTEWNLISEKELIMNDQTIRTHLTTKSLERTYNRIAFDDDGKYDWERYNALKALLQ